MRMRPVEFPRCIMKRACLNNLALIENKERKKEAGKIERLCGGLAEQGQREMKIVKFTLKNKIKEVVK